MSNWIPSFGQHVALIAIALLVYIVSTRVRNLRRAPAAAIAWVMGLALVPYLFLPLYLLFGQRKFKVAQSSAPIVHPAVQVHWAAQLIQCFALPPPAPVRVRFHADGRQALEALWETLEAARYRLDVSTFLIGDDAVGREAIARLARRARAGVQVRVLIDGAGRWLTHSPSFKDLRGAGAQVAQFRPLLGLRRAGPRNLRNHRKLVIADDTRLWSGGRNLAAEYFTGRAGEAPWIDLSFDLTGAVADAAARQFDSDWAVTGADVQPRRVDVPATPVLGSLAQFLPTGPDQAEDTAEALLVAGCFRAERRVLAVTPYFVPDEALLTALRLAALRGVRVTLVLPAVSNHRLADFVRGRALRVLAHAGAEIRLIPRMVHAKAVVIDDTLGLCGSINLDARSLLINYESAVVFYSLDQVAWLARWIEALAASGVSSVPAVPGLARDVAEGLLLTLAFQL